MVRETNDPKGLQSKIDPLSNFSLKFREMGATLSSPESTRSMQGAIRGLEHAKNILWSHERIDTGSTLFKKIQTTPMSRLP
jgi:hypothetical protein